MLFTGGMTDVLQLEIYSIFGCTFVTVAKWNTLWFWLGFSEQSFHSQSGLEKNFTWIHTWFKATTMGWKCAYVYFSKHKTWLFLSLIHRNYSINLTSFPDAIRQLYAGICVAVFIAGLGCQAGFPCFTRYHANSLMRCNSVTDLFCSWVVGAGVSCDLRI